MSIDDYRPTFVVEAVYDLKAEDLLRRGIHAVLVDLDNTLIAWNNPDGTPEVLKKQFKNLLKITIIIYFNQYIRIAHLNLFMINYK